MHCPVCSQALENGELVMVCGNCHKALGGLQANATGEFTVPAHVIKEALAEAAITPPGERVQATNVCSWCGKLEVDVRKLLGRGNAALCNECVALACDVMEAELGPNWKG
ncbi:MAG: ClpX C4-type zinc finger protein [Kofleriaceae bacterium]